MPDLLFSTRVPAESMCGPGSRVWDVGPWSLGQVVGQPVDVGRPQTKDELLVAAVDEFDRLWQVVSTVRDADRTRAGVCEVWSVKDVLAHLDAWHEMFLGWEAAGSRGERPPMPARGFSWSQIPALNEDFYQRHKADDWDEVEQRLRESHARVRERVDAYDEEDLFTKKRFSWTGSTSVASYAISATSSHYSWATKLIKKAVKTFDAAPEGQLAPRGLGPTR